VPPQPNSPTENVSVRGRERFRYFIIKPTLAGSRPPNRRWIFLIFSTGLTPPPFANLGAPPAPWIQGRRDLSFNSRNSKRPRKNPGPRRGRKNKPPTPTLSFPGPCPLLIPLPTDKSIDVVSGGISLSPCGSHLFYTRTSQSTIPD